MYRILSVLLLAVFPAFSSYAAAGTDSVTQKGFILAQGSNEEIKLPVLPEPSVPLPPTTEEKKQEGSTVMPLPPSPPSPQPALPEPPALKDSKNTEVQPPAPLPVLPPTEEKVEPQPAPVKDEAKEEEEEEEKVPEEKTVESAKPDLQKEARAERAKNAEQCKPLAKKLGNCEAFKCEYPNFDKSAPDFVKNWEVVGKEGNECIYNESLPGNATLQCRFSEMSRTAFSAYLDSFMMQKPLNDEETLNIYTKAQKEECQIVGADGASMDEKTYNIVRQLPQNVSDYGASDAPKGDCQTLEEKLKTCEPFYCQGNDPVQEKFFGRKVEVERKIVGWLNGSCVYVQKNAGKSLMGCKYTKADGTSASQCTNAVLVEVSSVGAMFNRMTLAEKAAINDPTLQAPKEQEGSKPKKKKSNLMALSDHNFKTQVLPGLIYRKQYDEQNKNLPMVYYPEEYKAMTFAALGRGDLVAMKAFIEKIKEIDAESARQKAPLLGGINIQDDKGNTLLIRSVMEGNFMAARILAGEGANLNMRNKSGVTALQAAAYANREDIVALLLGMGANRDIADNYGRTALTHAIEKRYTGITKLLLSKKANPNPETSTASPPIVVAAKTGDAEAVASLLDNNATIDSRDSQGKTALMRAAENGHAAVVNVLIKRNANIFLQDRAGQTAEVLASAAGHTDVARLLASAAISKRLGRPL